MKSLGVLAALKLQCQNFCFSLAFLQLVVMLPIYLIQQHSWGIRGVFLTGSLQHALGIEGNELPNARAARMKAGEDSIYRLTKLLPAGKYDYAVALNGTWEETYGSRGTPHGENIPLELLEPHEVTFSYDSRTHWVTADYEGKAEEEARIRARQLAEGRTVVLVGSMQKKLGAAKDFDASDMRTKMTYLGNGLYAYTATLPPGPYMYKAAIDGKWYENYGADGSLEGESGSMNQPFKQPVTFYYNDITHHLTDSTVYAAPKEEELPILYGQLAPTGAAMRDMLLDNYFQVEIWAEAGIYQAKIEQQGKEPWEGEVQIPRQGQVTLYYDPKSRQVCVNDGHIRENEIWHDTWDKHCRQPFWPLREGEEMTLWVMTGRGDVRKAELMLYDSHLSIGDGVEYVVDFTGETPEVLKMEKVWSNERHDCWQAKVSKGKNGIYGYKFCFDDMVEYGEDAHAGGTGRAGGHGIAPFQFTVYKEDFHTPDWAKCGVAYQIVPDRFYNGRPENDNAREYAIAGDPLVHQSWDELPELWEVNDNHRHPTEDWRYNDFYGGDFEGIRQKLGYLQQLGITAVYLNPVLLSGTSHRYDTVDYDCFDPILGTEAEFRNLVEEMKERGINLIVDGVFNHVGADSIYFDRYGKYEWVGAYEYWSRVYDLMNHEGLSEEAAKGEARRQLLAEGQRFSPYGFEDWFAVYNERGCDYRGDKYNYHGWLYGVNMVPYEDGCYPLSEEEGMSSSLGRLLLYGEEAAMMSWQKYGFHGWRFDASNEVPPYFWQQVRRKIKEQQDDYLLLGEIWHDGSRLLTGDQLDSLTNYNLYFRLTDNYLREGKAEDLQGELNFLWQSYPREAMQVMMNILGAHDNPRAIYKLGEGSQDEPRAAEGRFDYELGKARYKLGLVFIMGYPGLPTLFYGDEAGLVGSLDPDNRRTYPWGREDKELRSYCQKVIGIRNSHRELLGYGETRTLAAKGDIFAFERQLGEETAVVALNRGRGERLVLPAGDMEEGTVLKDALSGRLVQVKNGCITFYLPANTPVMLFRSQGENEFLLNLEESLLPDWLADWLYS